MSTIIAARHAGRNLSNGRYIRFSPGPDKRNVWGWRQVPHDLFIRSPAVKERGGVLTCLLFLSVPGSEKLGEPVPAGVLALLLVFAADAGSIKRVPGDFPVMD
jgi:hypothetical protein